MYKIDGLGGQRVKKGCHKIGAWAEIGQNRIRGGGGVRKTQKMWDIIYARSLSNKPKEATTVTSDFGGNQIKNP